MTDVNRPDLNGDWERQRRFLKEAHGLSDEEIEQLKQEYEDLGDLLDDVVEYGDRAEKLVDDTDEGSDRSSGETESVEPSSDQWERLEAWDLDVTTVDGREVVEAHQIDRRLRNLEKQIAEANEQVERINEIIDTGTEAESGLDIDVEEEQKNIEEQWDRINDAKERIGLPATTRTSTQDESWINCTVDKAYKSQEKLLEDGHLCALGPKFAEELGIKEDEDLRVRRPDQPEKSAVYTVNEIREQDAQLRISKKGRRRLDGKGSFKGEILPLNR